MPAGTSGNECALVRSVRVAHHTDAGVAKLVDATALEAVGLTLMRVRVPPPAPNATPRGRLPRSNSSDAKLTRKRAALAIQ